MDLTRTKALPIRHGKPKVLKMLLALAFLLPAGFGIPAQTSYAAGISKPFPQQVDYPGMIKPSHVTQNAMNKSVSDYYDYWKATYLKHDLSSLPGGYYVKGDITGDPEGFKALGSSEGQGYGMIITVLMAGHDPNAQNIYNGLFKTARAYKSSGNPHLMGWVVADSPKAQGHFGSATDGDLDIAYSLILAHQQWGSDGAVNYLDEARKMINDGIKVSYVTTNNRLNLGDWDAKDALNTRPSDWMLSHFRAFYEVTGDAGWIQVIDNLYSVYDQFTAAYSPTTGLVSDFVVGNPPKPAPEWYLDEFKETNQYYYNASRFPLRVVMDYAFYGDPRGKAAADKITGWIKTEANGSPANIKNGYNLKGTAIGDYATAVFVAPFISAGTADSANQAWINAGWDWMKNKREDYFSDTYNLLNLLFISGNWWVPEGQAEQPAVNLALNKTAVSSSIEGSDFEANKAFDGNLMSRWASDEGSDPEWIYVDLGSVQSISGVTLKWEAAYAKQYKIQVSTDSSGTPVQWTDVNSTTDGNGGVDEIRFSPQNARYVRMLGLERGTPYGYSLYEFEIYGGTSSP